MVYIPIYLRRLGYLKVGNWKRDSMQLDEKGGFTRQPKLLVKLQKPAAASLALLAYVCVLFCFFLYKEILPSCDFVNQHLMISQLPSCLHNRRITGQHCSLGHIYGTYHSRCCNVLHGLPSRFIWSSERHPSALHETWSAHVRGLNVESPGASVEVVRDKDYRRNPGYRSSSEQNRIARSRSGGLGPGENRPGCLTSTRLHSRRMWHDIRPHRYPERAVIPREDGQACKKNNFANTRLDTD